MPPTATAKRTSLLLLAVSVGPSAVLGAQAPAAAVDSFTTTVEFLVQGVTLRAQIHVAQGPGPHPTIVEVKGFQQADGWVAPYAPAQGMNGVTLDFRGQNASEGRYSPEYTPADLAGLVALLRTDRARREWRVDPARLVVVGSSAGTLAALATLGADPGVSCGGAMVPFNWGVAGAMARGDSGIRRQFEGIAAGVNPERLRVEPDMVQRVMDHAEAINTRTAATRLSGKVVFLIGAQRDDTAPLMLHFHPLVAAARDAGARLVRDTIVDDTHALPETWRAALGTLFRWIGSDCVGQ
jgi:hypothetical protein